MIDIKSKEEYNSMLEEYKDKTIILDFYAEWCNPCKMMLPILDELDKSEKVKVLKINTDNDNLSDLIREFNVRSIPTMALIKNKKLENIVIGQKSKPEMLAFIQ